MGRNKGESKMGLVKVGLIYLTAFVAPTHDFYLEAEVDNKTITITIVAE